jgi:hypothetical protein
MPCNSNATNAGKQSLEVSQQAARESRLTLDEFSKISNLLALE